MKLKLNPEEKPFAWIIVDRSGQIHYSTTDPIVAKEFETVLREGEELVPLYKKEKKCKLRFMDLEVGEIFQLRKNDRVIRKINESDCEIVADSSIDSSDLGRVYKSVSMHVKIFRVWNEAELEEIKKK